MFGLKRNKRTSLAKTIYKAEYKKAYLEQMKEEAAKKGKEAAEAESKKPKGSGGALETTQKFLAAGARVSDALIGTGPPQQNNNDKRRRLL